MPVIPALLVALIGASFAVGTGPSHAATSGGVSVGATIPSATYVDASGCATDTPNVTTFPMLPISTSAVTTGSCNVVFGSSNDTSMLLLSQQDVDGQAMWRPTIGMLDAAFDGPSGTGNGISRVDFDGSTHDDLFDVVRQPDGKLVAVGVG